MPRFNCYNLAGQGFYVIDATMSYRKEFELTKKARTETVRALFFTQSTISKSDHD